MTVGVVSLVFLIYLAMTPPGQDLHNFFHLAWLLSATQGRSLSMAGLGLLILFSGILAGWVARGLNIPFAHHELDKRGSAHQG